MRPLPAGSRARQALQRQLRLDDQAITAQEAHPRLQRVSVAHQVLGVRQRPGKADAMIAAAADAVAFGLGGVVASAIAAPDAALGVVDRDQGAHVHRPSPSGGSRASPTSRRPT